eukprot:9386427-Alexandrium_andersonii.AAC.1
MPRSSPQARKCAHWTPLPVMFTVPRGVPRDTRLLGAIYWPKPSIKRNQPPAIASLLLGAR